MIFLQPYSLSTMPCTEYLTDRICNKQSHNFDKRPHCRFAALCSGKCIPLTLTPSNTCFLRPTWLSPRMAYLSVHPFLHSSPVCQNHRLVTPCSSGWIRPTMTPLIHGSFGSHESAPQVAFWSIHPFLQKSSVCRYLWLVTPSWQQMD